MKEYTTIPKLKDWSLTRTLIEKVLPLCSGTVSVFYNPSQQSYGHGIQYVQDVCPTLQHTCHIVSQLSLTLIIFFRFKNKVIHSLFGLKTCHRWEYISKSFPWDIVSNWTLVCNFYYVWFMGLTCRICPWCNGYRHRKWTRQHEFKSWTRLIAFHISLIPLGKVWIQIFSRQLWVNSRADCVLQPWWGN